MPLKGAAFLALWNDIDPARDAEYNVWHAFEHVPERVGIARFLSGRRYVAWERSEDRYFTLYELETLAALAGPEYADVVDHPTEWSRSMRHSFRGFQRNPCTAFVSLGMGIAGSIATFRFDIGKSMTELDAAAATSILGPFAERAGITSVHLGRTEPDAAFPVKNAATAEAVNDAIQYVLLVEGIERVALDEAMRGIVGAIVGTFDARPAAAWKTFDLCYAIDRSSLQHPTTERQPERRDLRGRTRD